MFHRYNPEKVNFICNFFIDKGMTTALENFVHLTQPVFACDREFLYTKLIDVYKVSLSNGKKVYFKTSNNVDFTLHSVDNKILLGTSSK